MKCNDCRERGECVVERDPRWAHLCAKAARGWGSDLAQIAALSAGHVTGPPPTAPTPAPTPAKGRPPGRPPVPLVREAYARGLTNCEHGSPADCKCSAKASCSRLGKTVTVAECGPCLGLWEAQEAK